MKPIIGLYVHVPFCVRRCPYCAFYSVESAPPRLIEDYPRLILAELALRSQDWRGSALGSIYIGGGTPSLLKPSAIHRILQAAAVAFDVLPDSELTLEVNPGTLTKSSILAYREAGINRVSLGLQSLDDERLNFLGRIHNRAQALESLRIVSDGGFPSVSVDLMFGTPLETAASWDQEFEDLLRFSPQGISFYGLTLEEGTRLSHRARSGETVALTADENVDLMLHAADILDGASYRHYEVSNWAQPGSECRHNLHYWRRGSYLGLGPSAHSFDGRRRSWNLPDLDAHSKALDSGRLPPEDFEVLGLEEIREEWVYLQLRQAMGLNLGEYSRQFGEPPGYWKKMLISVAEKGMGEFDGVLFRPNDRGLLLADEISARLLG